MIGERFARELYEALRRKDLVDRPWNALGKTEQEDWVKVATMAGMVMLNGLKFWPGDGR